MGAKHEINLVVMNCLFHVKPKFDSRRFNKILPYVPKPFRVGLASMIPTIPDRGRRVCRGRASLPRRLCCDVVFLVLRERSIPFKSRVQRFGSRVGLDILLAAPRDHTVGLRGYRIIEVRELLGLPARDQLLGQIRDRVKRGRPSREFRPSDCQDEQSSGHHLRPYSLCVFGEIYACKNREPSRHDRGLSRSNVSAKGCRLVPRTTPFSLTDNSQTFA
jgi:hypothetical protein